MEFENGSPGAEIFNFGAALLIAFIESTRIARCMLRESQTKRKNSFIHCHFMHTHSVLHLGHVNY